MKKNYRPWVQVSLKNPNDPPDKTKITYIRPAPRPYSVVSVLAKDISAANSMPAGDSNTAMPKTSSTTTGIAPLAAAFPRLPITLPRAIIPLLAVVLLAGLLVKGS